MALRIEGDFGNIVFSSINSTTGEAGARYMTIDSGAAINFFRKIAIVNPDITMNDLGLFSLSSIGRNDRISFASFRTPTHLLSSRKNGCVWTPKGKVRMDVSEFSICPVEYMGEECPDAFWGDCLEKIFGVGNQVRDFFGTPESRAITAELVRLIYTGLGNSLYELIWWGQHPLIDDADANDWYTEDDEKWADYTDQQAACGGLMTIVDGLKNDQGLPHYNVQILQSEVDGEKYTGDPEELFARCKAAAPPVMALALKTGRNMGSRPIILVTRSVFEAYEEKLTTTWTNIPETFYYHLNGQFPAGTMPTGPVDGVLRWKGNWVVCMDAWSIFDTITGTITHRCMYVTAGVFGIGYDVPSLRQFEGQGLRLTQRLDAPYMGMMYMDTTFKVGTGIIDKDFIVNASLTLVPGAGI